MAIETLSDIVSEVADKVAVYGACSSPDDDRCPGTCRCCFESNLSERIRDAVHTEDALNAERRKRESGS